MDCAHLYALIDPNTSEIRYIGKTHRKSVNSRLSEHIWQSKRHKYHVSNWIKGLTANGQRPHIKTLVTVPSFIVNAVEIDLIKHYRGICNLTNISDGGEHSNLGKKWSKETRIKMINSGAFEKLRIRMLTNNPGKNQVKKNKIKTTIPRECKLSSINMKRNNPSVLLKKIVQQFDVNNNLLKEWESTRAIQRELGFHSASVSKCCRGLIKCGVSNGYIWKYKTKKDE